MHLTLPDPLHLSLAVSGEKLFVTYLLQADVEREALEKAKDICLEQTVEFPDDLVPPGSLRDTIIGKIVDFGKKDDTTWFAQISFAFETFDNDLLQMLNVIFGNISIKPGIKVIDIALPESFAGRIRGPRFGVEGIRKLVGVEHRPLICTALKPMGLSAEQLAEQAYRFARGGIDLIKDDHGLADQPFAPFTKRVRLCSEAVRRANEETGRNCLYLPNITCSADRIRERAHFAKECGAGGLLISTLLTGFDSMRMLADSDELQMPIMAHPAFSGVFVTSKANGISHGLFYGLFMRLFGADMSVYPNFGGRFSFSVDECRNIAEFCRMPLGGLKEIFPTPGGGMTTDKASIMLDVYGRDFILLIGGGLHRHSPDIEANARYFVQMLEKL